MEVKSAETFWGELHALPEAVRVELKEQLFAGLSVAAAKVDLIREFPADLFAVRSRAAFIIKQAQDWEKVVRQHFAFDPTPVAAPAKGKTEDRMYLKDDLDK